MEYFNKIKNIFSNTINKMFSFLWVVDPGPNEKSVSLSVLIFSLFVASTKLFLSGSSFHLKIREISIDNNFGTFSGGEWALVVGTAAGLYWARKESKKKTIPKNTGEGQ